MAVPASGTITHVMPNGQSTNQTTARASYHGLGITAPETERQVTHRLGDGFDFHVFIVHEPVILNKRPPAG